MNICLHEFEVKGILDGTLEDLWRPCKVQPPGEGYQIARLVDSTAKSNRRNIDKLHWVKIDADGINVIDSDDRYFESPFGPIGTRIVGKEVFAFCESASLCKPGHINKDAQEHWIKEKLLWYRADGEQPNIGKTLGEHISGRGRWRPSNHMPPWASRITLINAGVEIKPVRDITEEEAKAAGMAIDEDPYWIPTFSDPDSGGHPLYQKSFQYVWDYFYDKKGYPFESAYGWKLKFESEVKR